MQSFLNSHFLSWCPFHTFSQTFYETFREKMEMERQMENICTG